MFKSKLLKIAIFFFLTFPFLGIQDVRAAGNFNVTVDRTYEVDTEGLMHVTESHTVKNNSSNLYIPKNSIENFQILTFRIGLDDGGETLERSVATARIFDGSGTEMTFDKEQDDEAFDLKVKYPRDLRSGQSITFKLEYSNYELAEQVGALWDIYIHGFDESFKFTGGNTTTNYNTSLIVPDSLGAENFVNPKPISNTSAGGKTTYKFSQESLIDAFIWTQRGKTQIYRFKIEQEVNSTGENSTGFYNQYKFVIPRDIDGAEIQQKVFYTDISPMPKYVEVDDEGNLIGVFEFGTDFSGKIVVEGYAEVQVIGDIDETVVTNLSDVPQSLNSYLEAAEFWEVDDPDLQAKALELKGNKTNVFNIVESTYQFVVDSIDYSQVKRFGINERQGASATFHGGSAVCMEYSDLFLTLSRAQGIPVRAAFGYGYDSRTPSDEQEAHQWVDVYMPGIDKWVGVDVTWGESGTTLIGGDLNHFYTHVAGENPNTPPMIELLSYGGNPELETPQFEIEVVDSIPSGTDLIDVADLLETYPYVETPFGIGDRVNQVITVAGSLVNEFGVGNTFLTVGICMVLVLGLVTMTSVVKRAKKRKKKDEWG
ncbi:MAG TPA: hypothetical protein ENI23_11130 [bacterium]|nr:hypothetical protein [bacterium]